MDVENWQSDNPVVDQSNPLLHYLSGTFAGPQEN
ncbi:hypothetical protein PHMEG_00029804 [Phytophthora megakarya]|uniref:Uncharacterized protein n=1 Tax=Phytophthora megakarya TaxID=4795 RepID=A0A225V494_9STRA|nr:hypothetical protein PHMEG_00029804 [Phytophthora megakarya]